MSTQPVRKRGQGPGFPADGSPAADSAQPLFPPLPLVFTPSRPTVVVPSITSRRNVVLGSADSVMSPSPVRPKPPHHLNAHIRSEITRLTALRHDLESQDINERLRARVIEWRADKSGEFQRAAKLIQIWWRTYGGKSTSRANRIRTDLFELSRQNLLATAISLRVKVDRAESQHRDVISTMRVKEWAYISRLLAQFPKRWNDLISSEADGRRFITGWEQEARVNLRFRHLLQEAAQEEVVGREAILESEAFSRDLIFSYHSLQFWQGALCGEERELRMDLMVLEWEERRDLWRQLASTSAAFCAEQIFLVLCAAETEMRECIQRWERRERMPPALVALIHREIASRVAKRTAPLLLLEAEARLKIEGEWWLQLMDLAAEDVSTIPAVRSHSTAFVETRACLEAEISGRGAIEQEYRRIQTFLAHWLQTVRLSALYYRTDYSVTRSCLIPTVAAEEWNARESLEWTEASERKAVFDSSPQILAVGEIDKETDTAPIISEQQLKFEEAQVVATNGELKQCAATAIATFWRVCKHRRAAREVRRMKADIRAAVLRSLSQASSPALCARRCWAALQAAVCPRAEALSLAQRLYSSGKPPEQAVAAALLELAL
eukprot:TRINITY_DN6618_c0_g1_i1.p1 TRINITY_DN6618_c0_g1~~TRINITY_DN6618_c0_g1_i1.p1  ORF type:complete len:609 (+),score=86.01 TRINITY_DN6618_c0_g1_i1:74-1900(+)